MGAFRRNRKSPAQQNLERDVLWAVARLGRHYGRPAALTLIKELVYQIQSEYSVLSQTIDGQHEKEKT